MMEMTGLYVGKSSQTVMFVYIAFVEGHKELKNAALYNFFYLFRSTPRSGKLSPNFPPFHMILFR